MDAGETGVGVMRFCPVILAGGKSTRMGRDKALLELSGGQTMLARAQTLLDGLVAPAGVEKLPTLVSGARPGGIPDRYEAAGPLGGLQAVVAHLHAHARDCVGLLVVPVDMPMLTPGPLQTLCVSGMRAERAVCFDTFYLPCWLPLNARCRGYLNAAVQGRPTPSLRALFDFLGWEQLPVPEGEWHLNVNRPEEFAQIAALEARSSR